MKALAEIPLVGQAGVTMSTTPRSSAKKSGRLANWVFGTGIGAMVLLFVFLIVMFFGKVSGEEFSPSDFKRRSFHYYELPLVGMQVWPIKHFDATGDLETELATKKLIPVTTPTKPRWDLVQGLRAARVVREGDAYILCRYLDQRQAGGKVVWQDWTSDHPDVAAIFWPVISRLADQELYVFVPEAFDLAKSASDAKTFQAALNTLLAQKYYDFGLNQQQLGHHEAAIELVNEALKLAPEKKPDWQKTLELSLLEQATAKQEK